MPVKLSDAALAELNALLDAYPQSNHPGTLVGIVNREGELLFLRSTGLNDINTGEKYRDDTVFWIASCTKMVTSVAAMQLVEQGKVSLDEPIGRLLPEIANPDVVVSSTETSIETRKAVTPITLRMLLTHTAGYTYPWYSEHIRRWTKQASVQHVFRPIDMPLVHEPGTRFDYGVAMDWVGATIERASGESLDTYCKKNIFEPLGMKESTWDLATRPELIERLAKLHSWDSKTGAFGLRDWPHSLTNVTNQSGGGGLMTTGADFLKLLSVLLNGGVHASGIRILKEETVKDMFSNHCADLPDLGALGTNAVVATTDTGIADGALILLPGQRKGWGLGHLLNLDDIPGGRKAHSGEWGGIANLFWLADPTSQVAMIVFNEVLPYGLPAFEKLEHEVQNVVYSPGALIDA